MATNITGVSMTQPAVDPDIAAGGDFPMGGQISTSGGGGWGESGDMYFEWDQGTSTWATIGGSGDLYTEDTNPITGLQTTDEQVITVKSDGTAGNFQVRVKLIEDDSTEHTTTPVDVTVTEEAGPETYYQNAGQSTMSISGILNRQGHKDAGAHSMALAGSLGTVATFPVLVGGHGMTIAGALSSIVTHICNVGAYAMTITGGLVKQTSKALGEYAVTITGTLNKQGYKAVGGYAVTITGVLATATIFLQAVGNYAMSITGSLIKKTSVFIGKGIVSPVGNIIKKTSLFIGKASMSITGALSSIATFGQSTGGGNVKTIGILGAIVIYACSVGGAVMAITGSLLKKTSIFIGKASLSIAGSLSPVYSGIIKHGKSFLKKLSVFHRRSRRGCRRRRR